MLVIHQYSFVAVFNFDVGVCFWIKTNASHWLVAPQQMLLSLILGFNPILAIMFLPWLVPLEEMDSLHCYLETVVSLALPTAILFWFPIQHSAQSHLRTRPSSRDGPLQT